MKFWKGTIYSINAAAFLLGAASLFSRILGVFRDRLLSSHFGASRELDIYYAAFRVPDFLFNIFLLGAASVAIIPIFAKIWGEDEERARGLMKEVLTIFLASAVLLSLLAVIFVPYLAPRLFPGFDSSAIAAVIRLTRIMMLSPVLLGLSTIISTVTQVFRRFFVYALSGIFYNLGIIFGILFFLPRLGLPGLALGVVCGALLHFLAQIPTYYDLGFKLGFDGRVFRNLLRGKVGGEAMKIFMLSFPRVIALLTTQITIVVLVALASTLVPGSISIFQFASNLIYLPIGVLGVSFSVAVFPVLSSYFIRGDAHNFWETFVKTLYQVFFWVTPLAILFFVLRAQIVRVALGAGHFSWLDTRLTAASLGVLAITIITESLLPTVIKSFYALGNTKKPLFFDVGTSLLTIVLAFFLIPFFTDNTLLRSAAVNILHLENIRNLGVLALALAMALGSTVNLFLLSHQFTKEARQKLGVAARLGKKEIMEVSIASLLAGLVSFAVLRLVNAFISLDTFLGVFIQGASAFTGGVLTYAALLFIWGNNQMRSIIVTFKRRLVNLRVLPKVFD